MSRLRTVEQSNSRTVSWPNRCHKRTKNKKWGTHRYQTVSASHSLSIFRHSTCVPGRMVLVSDCSENSREKRGSRVVIGLSGARLWQAVITYDTIHKLCNTLLLTVGSLWTHSLAETIPFVTMQLRRQAFDNVAHRRVYLIDPRLDRTPWQA